MNIKQKNQLINDLKSFNKKQKYEYDFDNFIYDTKRYIKAIKEGRVICNIDHVSNSGMSRTLKFVEMAKDKHNNRYYLLNFYILFDFFGYAKINNSDYFRVYGCGMDMVFASNYSNIHAIKSYGIINKKVCDVLAQKTPSCI